MKVSRGADTLYAVLSMNEKEKARHSLERMELILPALHPLRLVFVSSGVVATRGKGERGSGPDRQDDSFIPCAEVFMRSLTTFSHHNRTPPAASSSDDL